MPWKDFRYYSNIKDKKSKQLEEATFIKIPL